MQGTTAKPAENSAPDSAGTVDEAEIARFSAMAATWWDPHGPFRPLHRFNPVRLGFVRDTLCAHFGRDPRSRKPLTGLRLLDIGCGGGLLCEPLARLGAEVVGADAGAANIKTAAVHAQEQGLAIDYRATTAEALADAGETFDAILNMEVIEHVADIPAFLSACSAMLKPEGLMICATINRTLKALGLAIIGAEYILRWLPPGTHNWSKFVTPGELKNHLAHANMQVIRTSGVTYNPLRDSWRLSDDTDVNYMAVAVPKPA